MSTVCLFTMKGCQYCDEFKEILKKENLSYQEYDVDDDEYLWKQIVNQIGDENLPTVFIRNEDESLGVLLMPDINVESQEDMLEKIKESI
tara:strand:- start:1230 stop:1499 length:270 start_codon:yes stop_codon:yes gene_type:complete